MADLRSIGVGSFRCIKAILRHFRRGESNRHRRRKMSITGRTKTVVDLGYQPRHYLQRIPPRIPILGDVEIIYHDDHGWLVDHSRFFMTYVGLVSFYKRMGDGPYFHLDGPYRISQRLPFSEMWYPPRQREFPDNIWNMVNRSVASSHVGMVRRGQRQRSVQTMYHYHR